VLTILDDNVWEHTASLSLPTIPQHRKQIRVLSQWVMMHDQQLRQHSAQSSREFEFICPESGKFDMLHGYHLLVIPTSLDLKRLAFAHLLFELYVIVFTPLKAKSPDVLENIIQGLYNYIGGGTEGETVDSG